MLVRIETRDLHNAEAVAFNKRLLARIVSSDPFPAPFAAALDTFREHTEGMDALIQKAPFSRYTDDLQAADALRDRYTVGLFTLCTGYTYSENEAQAAAANLLLEGLKPYGSATELTTANYSKATTLVENLVRDLRARPDLADALRLLGLNGLLNALTEANSKFRELQESRTDDEMNGPDADALVLLRRDAAKAYTALMKGLESAYHYTGGAEPWLGIVAGVNQVTEEVAETLARRKGVAAAKAPAAS
ncbi:DUF6261 family protein [Flaviaesturariibacter amylovorans]|uniref:Uncharacterized protein n=1 Tax=Flaviaesturariibacter amylovorans TaxID=1084520 RepID=A0ABP8HVG5_9BACT